MFDHLPTVGQPGEFVSWWPSALIRCRCRDSEEQRQLVLVTVLGMGNICVCPACHMGYRIVGMKPDGAPHIQFVPPEPVGLLQ